MELLIDALSDIYEKDQKMSHPDPSHRLKQQLGIVPEGVESDKLKKTGNPAGLDSQATLMSVGLDEESLKAEQEDLQSDITRLQAQFEQLQSQRLSLMK